jgi:hypothetical protein
LRKREKLGKIGASPERGYGFEFLVRNTLHDIRDTKSVRNIFCLLVLFGLMVSKKRILQVQGGFFITTPQNG